jgi:hypothetical protein
LAYIAILKRSQDSTDAIAKVSFFQLLAQLQSLHPQPKRIARDGGEFMKAARVFFLVIAVFSFRGAALCLQASTPEGALEEMVTTDKIETLASHLPVKIEEAINALNPKEKEDLSKKLLVKNLIATKGETLHKADDGVTWEVLNDKGELEGSLRLKSSFISGTDALVSLSVIEKESARGEDSQQRSSPAPASRRIPL